MCSDAVVRVVAVYGDVWQGIQSPDQIVPESPAERPVVQPRGDAEGGVHGRSYRMYHKSYGGQRFDVLECLSPKHHHPRPIPDPCELIPWNLFIFSFAEVCVMKKKVGPCRGYFPRWYYDVTKGLCLQFIYGGCRGNQNNFEHYVECKQICEMIKGSCNVFIVPTVKFITA